MADIKLFPYQEEGVKWLTSKKVALLADEMGLGKSAQAIRAARDIGMDYVAVICPAIARVNWQREFQKFWPEHFPHVVSYEGAVNGKLQESNYDLLILDEAHYLKNKTTKRTQAILGKKGIVRKAERIWALTGTPCPNHPGELWPLLYTFGATDMDYMQFLYTYCDVFQGNYGLQVTGAKTKNIPKFRDLIQPIMLRRLKEDVMKELPPISFQTYTVEPCDFPLDEQSSFIQYCIPPEKRVELEAKLQKERMILEGAVNIAPHNVDLYKTLEALAGSVSTLRRYTGLQKVGGVAEILLDELENNAYEKVVIFAIHRDVIEMLRAKLSKFGPVTLYGGHEPATQVKNIDRFQKNPKCRVIIANIQTAGTSITLTAAHQVVFVEQDWVPGNNAQAVMRCHRIGQKSPVFVRFFALANSVDEKIAQVLKRKTRDLSAIFDDPQLTKTNHGYKTSNSNSNDDYKSNDNKDTEGWGGLLE